MNGLNAFTLTTNSFIQPSVSGTVVVNISNITPLNNQWAIVGQVVYIGGGGYYLVTSVPTLTSVQVQNLGYAGNAAPGVTIPTGQTFSPGGLVGPPGQNGIGGTSILFNDHTANSQVGQGNTDLFSYTLPAATMDVDEDALEIEYYAERLNVPNNNPAVLSLLINGSSVGIGGNFNFTNEVKAIRTKVLLSRTTATSVSAMVDVTYLDITTVQVLSVQLYIGNIVVNDLDNNTNVIALNAGIVNLSPAQTITGEYMLIKLLQK